MIYRTGDTYNEIENGEVVDYYCFNNQKYNTPTMPLFTGPSCLYSAGYYPNFTATVAVNQGEYCFEQEYGNYLVCDPVP